MSDSSVKTVRVDRYMLAEIGASKAIVDVLGRFDVLVSNALENDHASMASYAIARAVRRVGGFQ